MPPKRKKRATTGRISARYSPWPVLIRSYTLGRMMLGRRHAVEGSAGQGIYVLDVRVPDEEAPHRAGGDCHLDSQRYAAPGWRLYLGESLHYLLDGQPTSGRPQPLVAVEPA